MHTLKGRLRFKAKKTSVGWEKQENLQHKNYIKKALSSTDKTRNIIVCHAKGKAVHV